MRPTVQGGVAILRPQGFLDGNNIMTILSAQDTDYVMGLEISAFLVSFKGVIAFNHNAIDFIVKIVSDLRARKNMTVGICDYDARKYDQMMKHMGNDPSISLFESEEVARLFLSHCCEQKKVLLYHDNVAQKGVMLLTLHERGYSPVAARDEIDFKEKAPSFDVAISRSYFGNAGNSIASYIRGNIIVYTLHGFLDGELGEAFDLKGFRNSLMVGFKLFVFECSMVSGVNVHAVNFLCRLATESAEYGVMIVLIGLDPDKVTEKFMMDLGYVGIVPLASLDALMGNEELMAHAASAEASAKKCNRMLTKEAISLVPSFIDATIETLETMTGVKAVKQGVKVDTIDFSRFDGTFYASSMGFYGDADGMIVLVFQKKIAQKACMLLLQEDEATDEESVIDALAELVNIIAGKTKTRLVTGNTHMNITLPRTFRSLNDLAGVVGGKRGAKVDFMFDGEPFMFFLTR